MISIIIPTFNEEENIGRLVSYLILHGNNLVKEVIVCDGGSKDQTLSIAEQKGAQAIECPEAGRAAQMNYGASVSTGDILYFVHADTIPPQNFACDIMKAVNQQFDCGRYQTQFDCNRWILKVNAFFTRFDWFICYGGDQTFFITKELFTALNGYDATMEIMEEYDLVQRAKQKGRYKIFNKAALVSARKYKARSWWQVQRANKTAVKLFRKGAPQIEIVKAYKAMLQ